jgi:hypothetical protein
MSQSYEVIFENNRKWVESKVAEDPNFFHELAKTQHPDYLYIGCSDSRATAEELMGANREKFCSQKHCQCCEYFRYEFHSSYSICCRTS